LPKKPFNILKCTKSRLNNNDNT